jgi:hypothetical protein
VGTHKAFNVVGNRYLEQTELLVNTGFEISYKPRNFKSKNQTASVLVVCSGPLRLSAPRPEAMSGL